MQRQDSQIYPSYLPHTETLGLLIKKDAMNHVLELGIRLRILLRVGWWRPMEGAEALK